MAAEKTDARALFDALGPAYDTVQAKVAARDALAAKLADSVKALQALLDAAQQDAEMQVGAANADVSEASDTLKALQQKIAALVGTASDPTRIR